MQKIKKIILLALIIVLLPIKINAIEESEEYEKIDYTWLDSEIETAREAKDVEINSKSAIVYCRNSKTIIWGKNESIEVPMASTTKIMTAIIMLEKITNLDEEVEVSKQAALVGGSRLGLKVGDKITYNDLLYGLLLCSGNDAATQIAISVGGDIESFAKLMNTKAKEIGLKHTNFVTPHGLDNENHYTTALELAIMTDYALNNSIFTKVVSTKNYSVNINGHSKTINNTNELLGYLDGVNGVKTGFTNGAGRCLVTSVSRDGFNIITVVLGADSKKIRTKDSIKLIEYTYKNYKLVNLKEQLEEKFQEWKRINENRVYVYKGIKNNINMCLNSDCPKEYPILKNEESNIYIELYTYKYIIEAPIEEGYKIGEATIVVNTRKIMQIDIVSREKILKKDVKCYFKELLCLIIR